MTNKTQPTTLSVAQFLNNIADPKMRKDCKIIAKIMKEVSQEKPLMWGESIVGYGTYHYKYSSGREGEFLRMGFSLRKSGPTIYLIPGYENSGKILSRLGPHKLGKSCLYLKNLDEINLEVLRELIQVSHTTMTKLYPTS